MLNKYKKLAVVGSRLERKTEEQKGLYAKVEKVVYNILDRFYAKFHPTLFVSGGATGIDTIAEDHSKKKKISRHIIVPNWYPFGEDKPMDKGAGFKRNKDIIEMADFVIAFTNGSNGTANSIDWAKKMNKPLTVFNLDGILIEKHNIND